MIQLRYKTRIIEVYVMQFTIIFEYKSGKLETENKVFNDWAGAEHWAEKEMIERGAKTYWIR